MADNHCPLAGECKFIDDIWNEIRYMKARQEKEMACVKKREGDYISMNWFKILLTILIVVFAGIFGLGWSIKADLGSIDKSVAVNSSKMISIEKQIERQITHERD